MDERVKFIARFLEGEKVAGLAVEFGVSRKTGYKIIERYRDTGLEGLTDRSRRPYRHANQLPFQIEALIVRLKQEKPSWGAPKIMELLARRYSLGVTIIVLLRLDVWPHVLRRHETGVVALRRGQPAEMMSATTGLHRDNARR